MSIASVTAPLRSYFAFPLRDRQSVNRFLVGSGLLLGAFLVPLIPVLLVYGYALRIARRTIAGEPPEMIPWDDWGDLLWLGFRGFLVSLVYTMPGTIVYALAMALYFVASLMMPLSAEIGGTPSDASVAFFLVAAATMVFAVPVGTLLLVLGIAPLPAAMCHFVQADRLKSAFSIDEWWPILSANRLGYLISFVIVGGVFTIAYWVPLTLFYTIILACIGLLVAAPLGFYPMLLAAAVFGDTYRAGRMAREAAADA